MRGLESVKTELDRGRFRFTPQDEDIHMAIERRLTELIGPLGGKLHTGRSRNDQVALDVRLYLRDQLGQLLTKRLRRFPASLGGERRRRIARSPCRAIRILQRAQPVLFAHHLLAYVEMFERDKGRIAMHGSGVNVMPLGSGALAGTNYPVDRRFTAGLLGFPPVTQNSLDAVSDRDFMIESASALSITMMHLSRLSEELILWSSAGVSIRRPSRCLLHRQQHDAAKEESRCAGIGPGQDGPGLWPFDQSVDYAEGPPLEL